MMRKLNTALITTLAMLAIGNVTFANPIIPIPSQAQPIIKPTLPNINAKAFILIDAKSGQVLAEKNADVRMAPASLTKLMSLYVVDAALKSGSIHPDDKVKVSTKAWQTGGSRMFIKVNDEVPLKDLVKGIAIASGNDASVAVAEYIAGTEETFADMMNSQAKALGMNNSHFMDSTGLPNPQHYSTARDFATLAQALIRDYPDEYKLYSEKWFTYNNIRQPNRNRLLWNYPYADGLKTGHTDDAGFCLVGSAQKDGMRLISVIMGSPSDTVRTEESVRLLTYGFRFYETHKIVDGGKALTTGRVWKGSHSEVPLGVEQDWYATLPTGAYKNMQQVYQVNDPLNAPIVKGQAYGNLNLVLNNQVLISKPLVALEDDPKGGMFRSITDAMRFRIQKIFSKSSEKVNNG